MASDNSRQKSVSLGRARLLLQRIARSCYLLPIPARDAPAAPSGPERTSLCHLVRAMGSAQRVVHASDSSAVISAMADICCVYHHVRITVLDDQMSGGVTRAQANHSLKRPRNEH